MTCSGDSRSKAQSEAACSAAASMPAGSAASSIRSPSGHGMVAGSPGGGGSSRIGSSSMSSKVWSGARITQPMPSRNAARMMGVAPGRSDRHGLALPVDHVVAPARRADGLAQVRQLLGEDLLERAVGREQPVAHEDGLLAVPDHLSIEAPVVVGLVCWPFAAAPRSGVSASVRTARRFIRIPPSSFRDARRLSGRLEVPSRASPTVGVSPRSRVGRKPLTASQKRTSPLRYLRAPVENELEIEPKNPTTSSQPAG